jgi:hypothetical protein
MSEIEEKTIAVLDKINLSTFAEEFSLQNIFSILSTIFSIY